MVRRLNKINRCLHASRLSVFFIFALNTAVANESGQLAYAQLPESFANGSVVIAQPEERASVQDVCRRIEKKLGSVAPGDCEDNQFVDSGGYSVGGLPIIYKEYAPLEGKQPLSRVLLIGGIHGDEYSSISIVFNWMRMLNQHHSGLFHWRVVPLMNPDGLLRKKSQRMNKNGVDLNRNFPTPNWEVESHNYWVEKTKRNPRRYPGPSPLSEPESQWLAKTIGEFKPDVIVSVHAPYGILDFDGPRSAPKRLGHLHLNLLGTYPGSLGNYAGIQNQIPVVTIELPYAGIMPSNMEIKQIWLDLVRWLTKNARHQLQEANQEDQRENLSSIQQLQPVSARPGQGS